MTIFHNPELFDEFITKQSLSAKAILIGNVGNASNSEQVNSINSSLGVVTWKRSQQHRLIWSKLHGRYRERCGPIWRVRNGSLISGIHWISSALSWAWTFFPCCLVPLFQSSSALFVSGEQHQRTINRVFWVMHPLVSASSPEFRRSLLCSHTFCWTQFVWRAASGVYRYFYFPLLAALRVLEERRAVRVVAVLGIIASYIYMPVWGSISDVPSGSGLSRFRSWS